MADCILWDRDFEMEEMFTGASHNPATSAVVNNFLGISGGFFSGNANTVRVRPGAEVRLYALTHRIAYPEEYAAATRY